MKESRTVTGKPFHYEGSLKSGLRIYTYNKQGQLNEVGFTIYRKAIDIVINTIKTYHDIPMGTCRDNPAQDSIGFTLMKHRRSPQLSCYVVPIMRDRGLCEVYRNGSTYFVKLTQ